MSHIVLLFVSLLLLFPAQAPLVSLSTPAAFQVFQRINDTGSIVIQGTIQNGGNYSVAARWGDLTSGLLYTGVANEFAAVWPDLPVGQHDLILTVAGTEYTVPNVGIGDVYIIAGQSNAVGYGRNEQMYISTLGLRASMFIGTWQELADPTGRGNSAAHGNGSEWPNLATYILEAGVPVAFIPLAVSGTKIETWQPNLPRYRKIESALDALPYPRARAILWQQGEFNRTMSSKKYSAYLSGIADSLYNAYDVPTYAALLYQNDNVNAGILEAVQGSDAVRIGADLRDLKPDGIHYVSDDNLRAEAWLWWLTLQEWYL